MKNVFNKLLLVALILTIAGCSNDFLNENLDVPVAPAGESTIFISPEWEPGEYQFSLPGMGDADFRIEALPSWLQTDLKTGKLLNSQATIHCSATKKQDFDKIGIYLDKMEVSAGNQTFYVPVSYITEGNPTILVEKSVTVDGLFHLSVGNTGEGILVWDIVSLPDWLVIDTEYIIYTSKILSQYSSTHLSMKLNWDVQITKDLTGTIVLQTNDKNSPRVEIAVTIDLGSPEISVWLYDNKIDFGTTATTTLFDLVAWGSGLLVWHFENIPDWLTISPEKGIYRTHTYYDKLVFTCDRTKLQPGVNSSVIYLKSNAYNSPSIEITVQARAPGDNANIRAIEGDIVDVAFDKNRNTLYYATSQPDMLVAYDVVNRTVLRELQLSNAPTCFAVSEDCTRATVGHNGEISVVDLVNGSVVTKEVNGILSDIAWSDGDWFCYTVESYYSYYGLKWINTADFTLHECVDKRLYGKDIVKKVPTQPYIIATRRHLFPSGFFTYSASAKSLKNYSHIALGDFWFSEDGHYTYTLDKEIYRTPGETVIGIPDYIDRFTDDLSYYTPRWIDHCASVHNIWIIGDYANNPSIYQYDDRDFTYKKSYFYSDLYQPDAQTKAYDVEAYYLFSNKDGSELSVLRRGRENNNWSVEFIKTTT